MKNDYEIRGDIAAIIINSPKYGRIEALISSNKLQMVNEFSGKWHVVCDKDTKSLYVLGKMSEVNGNSRRVLLHRWVTNAPKGMVVDHRNHVTLDNTDKNLRVCTPGENQQNRKGITRSNKSGVRGVSWHKPSNKWKSGIQINKKCYYLGVFDTIEEARKVVEEARERMMPYSKEAYKNAN